MSGGDKDTSKTTTVDEKTEEKKKVPILPAAKESVIFVTEQVLGEIQNIYNTCRINTDNETKVYRRQAIAKLEDLRMNIITSGMGSGRHVGLVKGLVTNVCGAPIDAALRELRERGIE